MFNHCISLGGHFVIFLSIFSSVEYSSYLTLPTDIASLPVNAVPPLTGGVLQFNFFPRHSGVQALVKMLIFKTDPLTNSVH